MCYFYVGDSKGNLKTRPDSAEYDNMMTEEKELIDTQLSTKLSGKVRMKMHQAQSTQECVRS